MAKAVRLAGVEHTRTRSPRRGIDRVACSWLMAATVLACVPVASASAAGVSVTNGVLTVRDAVGESNIIDVVPTGMSAYFVLDQGPAIVPGPGCGAVSPQLVQCEFVTSVSVDAGPGDDLIGLNEVTTPVQVNGEGGDDLLQAGSGAAVIDAGPGIDAVIGGAAADSLSGGTGDDLLTGGASDDMLLGNSGNDIIGDEAGGEDVLDGGGGADLMRGGAGDDTLNGGGGDDVIVGGAGVDDVDTATGRDRVFGSSRDKVECDANDEVLGASDCGRGDPGTIPTRWPPVRDQEPRVAVETDLLPFPVHQPGRARRITVRYRARQNYPIRIRVYGLGLGDDPLGSFRATTSTRQADPVDMPERLRGAYKVLVQRIR